MELIKALIAQLPKVECYPTKHKKEEKKDPRYLHISNHYFEKADENGVVSIHRIGITYQRPELKKQSKRDVHRAKVA